MACRNNTIIPRKNCDPCNGNIVGTQCVIQEDALLDASGNTVIHENSSQEEVNQIFIDLFNDVSPGQGNITLADASGHVLGEFNVNQSNNQTITINSSVNDTIKTVKIHVTAAELQNLSSTTGKSLIPALGVGICTQILGITAVYNYNTTPYNNNGINLYVGSSLAETGWASYITGTSIDNTLTQSISFLLTPISSSNLSPKYLGPIGNNDWTLYQYNGGNPVGSGDGTVDLYITYKIVEL